MDRIQAMQEYGNLDGLLQILRQPGEPAMRVRAARAIGQMGELEAAEALTGAALHDPDPGVRQVARQALHDLLGDQAELALQVAQVGGEQEEDWLPRPEEDQAADPAFSDQTPRETMIDYQTLRGLIMIARGDPSRDLRLKAVASLARVADLTAIRALAELALWDEDAEIRAEAEKALHTRFGEQLPRVLEGYRREMMGEEEDGVLEETGSPYSLFPPPEERWETPPVHKEETASTVGCLLLVFLVLAGLYFLFR
jgi:hypothetical protein